MVGTAHATNNGSAAGSGMGKYSPCLNLGIKPELRAQTVVAMPSSGGWPVLTSTSTSDELDPLRFCLQRIGFRGLSLALELAGLFSISAFLLPGHLLQDCDWVDQHSALRPARVLCYLQRLLIIDEPIDGVHFMALQSGRVSNELKESEISTRESYHHGTVDAGSEHCPRLQTSQFRFRSPSLEPESTK